MFLPRPSFRFCGSHSTLRGGRDASTLRAPQEGTRQVAGKRPPHAAGRAWGTQGSWGGSPAEDPRPTPPQSCMRGGGGGTSPASSTSHPSMVASGPPSTPLPLPSASIASLPANLLHLSFWHLPPASPHLIHSSFKNLLLAHFGKIAAVMPYFAKYTDRQASLRTRGSRASPSLTGTFIQWLQLDSDAA